MSQKDEKTEVGLKKAIGRLITPDANFGINDLDSIYHEDMVVVMIDEKDNKAVFYKEKFKHMIAKKLNTKDGQDNTWVKFHHTEIMGDKAFMVMTRKVNITGEKRKLQVSLDFVWEDMRWQITKENIYSQPLD